MASHPRPDRAPGRPTMWRYLDPGIGISFLSIGGATGFPAINLLENGECIGGVQCPENVGHVYKYDSSMPSGELNVEAHAYNDIGGEAVIVHQILKVDGTAPTSLVLSGLPASHEIGDGAYTLTGEATDGSTGKPSSGIKSIGLTIDGNYYCEGKLKIKGCSTCNKKKEQEKRREKEKEEKEKYEKNHPCPSETVSQKGGANRYSHRL